MKRYDLRDLFHRISFLTPGRTLNLVKLWLSYWHSLFYRKAWMMGLPWSVTIEPNNTCNLHCPECPTGNGSLKRPAGMLEPSTFEKILSRLPRQTFYVNLYFQGEPILNPHCIDFIKELKSKNIYVTLSTNGNLLEDDVAREIVSSGLDELIVSMDGIGQGSYVRYRIGGNFFKVEEAIRNIVMLKNQLRRKFPALVLQSLLLRSNENHINEFNEYGKVLGVDKVEWKTAWFDLSKNPEVLMPEQERNRRYTVDGEGHWGLKYGLKNRCFRMWGSLVITWGGLVLPCCFDKQGDHLLGNITTQSLHQIWKSDDYQAFREKILTERKAIEMCQNCTGGLSYFRRS